MKERFRVWNAHGAEKTSSGIFFTKLKESDILHIEQDAQVSVFWYRIIGNRVGLPNDAVTVIEELYCIMPLPASVRRHSAA